MLRFDARAGECFQKQLGEDVDQHGHAEQHEADFKQRAQIQIAGGLVEFVGDDAGQRVAGREQRFDDLRRVADDHRDGHGFAERAAQSENDRAEQALFSRSSKRRCA